MKVIIAPDKFKGSLTCFEVCDAITAGIKAADNTIETFSFPMADGGDGFALVMQYYLNSETVECFTVDPLQRKIKAAYQWRQDKKTAIIEMATASGLVLLAKKERNPLKASSYGTGLLIKDAIEKGAEKIMLGLGGSATNDAGMGILAALGISFFDKEGNLLEANGENLGKIETIIPPQKIPNITFDIACDVQNTLFGPNGAACVYAPQKGGSVEEVKLLDGGLKHFATVINKITGRDVANIPGLGAAGGVAAGLMTFFSVRLKSGIDMVIDTSGIKNKMQQVDLLITGEGKIDRQTTEGKVIKNLVMLANKHNISAIAFCGVMENDASLASDLNLKTVESISSPLISIEDAMLNAKQILTAIVNNYFASKQH